MDEPNWMDLTEFRDAGYVQEVNRRFFHPLGLALAVNVEDDGSVSGIAGVIDVRDDPEGIIFSDEEMDDEFLRKTRRVNSEWAEKAKVRLERFGFEVQCVKREEE